jgi:hypothetical protein
MRSLPIIALVLVVLVSPSFGQDDTPIRAKAKNEPDHLVPVDPSPARWAKRYTKLWRKTLKLPKESAAAVMVYRPSFEGEQCLVIHESKKSGSRTFTLVCTRADRSIWCSMPENSDDGKSTRVAVTRHEATLPVELADRLCRVWERMLRAVSYPDEDEDHDGTDGVFIEFSRHQMYGETWSPTSGAPRGFVDLGKSLIDYCTAPEAKQAGLMQNIETRSKALERYLDQKTVKRGTPQEPRL